MRPQGNPKSTPAGGVDASNAPRSSVRKRAADEKMREGFSPSCTLRVANKGAREGEKKKTPPPCGGFSPYLLSDRAMGKRAV